MFKKENIYTRRSLKIDGEEHYYISFKDSVGNVVEVEVDEGVYSAIREHDLIDARIAWSDRMHIERLALSDEEIEARAMREHDTVEKEFLLHLSSEEVAKAIEELTDTQRRRFLLYRGSGMTLKEIAALERKSFSTIRESIKDAEEKLKKIYKSFLEEPDILPHKSTTY